MKSFYNAHNSILLSLAYDEPSETLISTGFDKYIKCFDIYEGTIKCSIKNNFSVYCTQILDKKRTIAAGCHFPEIAIFSKEFKILRKLEGHIYPVLCLLYLKKIKVLVSGSLDNKIILWNHKKGTPLKILDGHKRSVLQLIEFPDKNLLASFGYDNSLKIWDFKRGKNVKSIMQTNFKRESTHSLIYHYYASFVYIQDEKKFLYYYFNDNIKVKDSKIIEYESI